MLDVKVKNTNKEFKKIFKELTEITDKELKENVAKSLVDLKSVTPKDTGLAANSWQLEKSIDDVHGFDQYEVNNAVDYIGVLNSGSSKQAPKRFIEKTLLKYFEADGIVVKKTTIRR